ncbi:MAG: TRAP transporter small permease [Rhizobiaceae bacterium]|nr:TRAP transporter small permease [Rhizobiaceae bacterium]
MPLKSVVSWVRRLTDYAVVLIFAFMVVSVMLEVVGRYLNITISHSVETATFAQIWLTTIGASVALRHGSMFALDTFTRHLGLRLARAMSVVIAILGILLVGVLFYGGVILTEGGFRQTSPVLQMPMWPIFIALPIGMTLLCLEIVLQVFEKWNDPFPGNEEELS